MRDFLASPFLLLAAGGLLCAFQIRRRLGSREAAVLEVPLRPWVRALGILAILWVGWLSLGVPFSAGALPLTLFVGSLIYMYWLYVSRGGVLASTGGIRVFTQFIAWDDVVGVSTESWGIRINDRSNRLNAIFIPRLLFDLSATREAELMALASRGE
ncbi:MAG: hypothetical protein MJB57_14080 [Gemmatimonadetes bacterium]|nr:hypothetical protein [Gemmatimonadota bacterium]